MKSKRLTSLLAGVLLLISNGAQAKDSGQSLKDENNKNVSNNLKIDNNKIKKANNNLTTENLIIYLFGTLFLGGGLYYGVPYCRELYKKYVPVKPLNKEQPTLKTNTVFIANKKIQDQKKNICSNFKHGENEYEKFKNVDEKNKDLKNNIKLNSKYEKSGDKSLGEGAQGEAWLFKNLETGELVVVKTIKDEDAQKCEKLAYENREMLSACKYLCKPLDYFEENGVVYAVYEYIEKVDLKDFIKSEKDAVLIFYKSILYVSKAFKYLAEKGFYHNDFQVDNVVFTKDHKGDFTLKVIDYGRFNRESYFNNAKLEVNSFKLEFILNKFCKFLKNQRMNDNIFFEIAGKYKKYEKFDVCKCDYIKTFTNAVNCYSKLVEMIGKDK